MNLLVRVFTAILLAVPVCGYVKQPSQDKKPAAAALKDPSPKPIIVLREPIVMGIGESWAVVSWTTNAGGKGYSRVYAGTDPRSLKLVDQTTADTAVNSRIVSYQEQEYMHLIRLNNLKPATTYYFRADSGNRRDHGASSKSNVWKFNTLAMETDLIANRRTASATAYTTVSKRSALGDAKQEPTRSRESVRYTESQTIPLVAKSEPTRRKEPAPSAKVTDVPPHAPER